MGTDKVAYKLRRLRSFEKARSFVRSLGLKSTAEWRDYCKSNLPSDIPANPNLTYANQGWVSWGDWLGTGTIAPRLRKYRPFAKARAYARRLKLKSRAEWTAFAKAGKLPSDIPANPNTTYAEKGWSGMRDWLRTD